jgi:pimeloyl-ACP methyl ester carboxylesterase
MINDARVTVDGLGLRYLEAGAGPAVLMMHGASLGSSCEAFEDVIGPLAEAGYRVVAYDQPGYGLSDNPADYRVSYRVALIPQVLDALGMGTAVLVGHSQAGGMAVRAATASPDRISAVITVCSGTAMPPLPGDAPAAPGGGRDETASPTEWTLEDTRKLMESDVVHKAFITDALVEKRHRLTGGKNAEAAVERDKARESSPPGAPKPWDQLLVLPMPLLMLTGDNDRANAAERARRFQAAHPDVRMHVARDAAHMLMTDAPIDFVTQISEFLAGGLV